MITTKKTLALLAVALCFSAVLKANPVDLQTARQVAVKFVNANAKMPLRGVQDLQLATTYHTESGDAAFHIFNTPNGFVIVSADDCATPILGYSDEGRPFDLDNIPIQLQGYLLGFVEQIQYGIENHVQDETTAQQWESVRNIGRLNNNRDGEAVEPLITTQWGQTGVYGSMCPNGIVGCVGVAVAQVMNYWQYPEKGVGYINYEGNEAFFNETYYHWDSLYTIPDALPTLMYHAAIGSWSRFFNGSTGAGLNLAQSGLVSFFDYDTLSYFANKNDYFNSQWIALIKADLDNAIPVLYRGDIINGGGHAWVCDGYDENDMFHMNWGWEGLDDGWFLLSALNAGGWSITGGGAVFDLVPMNSPLQARFEYAKNDVNRRQISFFDFSKDAPNDYYWDFGDGNTSTLINPIHLYDTTGLYSVSLTVNKDGLSDIYSFVIEVKDLMYFEEIKSNIDELDGSGITIDYDMDGLQDLLWMDYDGSVKILKNCDSISPLGFSFNYVAEFQGCNVGTGRVVDFQNTNTPSVLCESWCYFENNNGTIIRDSSFNPSFYGQTDFWDGDEWSCSDVIDYNNDGLFDVVIGSTLYKNIGSKLFLPIENYFPDGFNSQFWSWAGNSRSIQRVSSIDIDKDGDLDIFSHHGLYLNNGDGTFQYVNIPSGWVSDDFNNDGWPDVIDCALHISSGADLSFDTRDTVFMQPIGNASYITFPNAEKQYHAHGDIDNDGYLDIFGSAVWPPDIIYSYKDSVLERKELDVTYWETKPLIWIDFNDDSSIDAINPLMILGNVKTYLYKNIHSNNMPPTAPTNLSVETFGNTVMLHWDASTDDHTYSGALTYNIAVGSAPDSCDIYSPLSNLETGKRYAVNKGNAGMGTLWRVNDLPNGTYYWRVQAIDQAFAASPFSEMGTFTISGNNLPPAMAPITKDCYMNKPNTFTREEFLEQYYDRDKDSLQSIIITQLPTQGTLFLNGNAVVEGQSISSLDLGQLYYVTTTPGNDAFKLKPFDGTDYSDYETTNRFHTTIFEPVWELDNISGDVAWGDYNNDGRLDFVATWGVYKNENGNFTQILDTVPTAEHVFWADVNNDGLLDAVFSETVLLNAGNDLFVWQEALSNQDGELSDMADANNDNKVDYLITSMDENLTALYLNTGSGFAEDSTYRNIPAFRDGNLKFADYNNDGMADFAITGWTDDGRETSLYRNRRLGFDKMETVLPQWGTGSLDWGDYDNDGDLDLIVCGYDGDEYKTAVYNNNHGTMSFVSTITLPGIIRGQAKWMDYDNDGLLDILLVGYDGNTACYLYKNTGFLTFNQIPTDQIGITPLWFSNVSIADFDGDGYQDVLLSGSDQNREAHTYLVRNTYGVPTSTTNITPEVPSNLQSVVNGNMVRLTWNKGSDNTTPQAAIAYNVFIRNEDNGEYEVSPLSDLQTGFRKVADRGNCGSNNFMDINSLDAGTYYWSVQSIDNGLMSSAFAPEQSFTVTCNLSVTEIYDTVQCAYYWNGDYYLNSSTATGQFTTAEGCDSTVIIHVQVLQDTCWNPIYVTESGAGLHNGDSWENAMGDLQKAIDLAAMHGSSIWVKQGTFKGDTIQENAFYVYNGVSIYGGFMGNEPADFDINLRNPMSHPTILDGQNAHRVLNSDDDGVNVLHNIDGFVLQNGKSDWYPGALLGDYSMIKNCIIRYNECIKGATHGVIQGGIVVNSIITRNTMSWIGVRNSILLNCVLANNDDVSDAVLSVMARNCIIMDQVNATWGEVPDVLNCAMVGAVVPEGNLVVSPDNDGDDLETNYVRFMDPENDDYRLSCGSACVNMGTTDVSGLDLPSVDLQGNPRVMDGVIDIGAYEFDLSGNNKNIVVSASLAEGGCVCGGGNFFCGEICTISAESNEGYFFVNWTEDGAFISKDSIYSFVVTDDRNLVANFWEDGIIDFADDIVKNICVEHWDTNGDGELSYREAAIVTSLDYAFSMNYEITSFDELQFFFNLANLQYEFSSCVFLRSIKIPSTITSIGAYSFFSGSSLGTIEISRSVNDISEYAFAYCVGLSSMIVLGETPPSLGWGAFEGVDHSIPVYVPCGSMTAYQNAEGWNEFTNFIEMCPGVITVTANPPEGGMVSGSGSYDGGATCTVTAAPNENFFFMNWTEDGAVVSSDSVYSFIVTNERNLTANFWEDGIIDFVDENVKNICVERWDTNGDGELSYGEAAAITTLDNAFSRNGEITSFDELQYFINLANINEYEFAWCYSLSSIVIPNSVTSIGWCAFEGCSSLSSIEIPSSVTSIGYSFGFCPNLLQIVVDSNNTVYDSRDNSNAIIATESNTLVVGCPGTVIPNTVTTIGDYAFYSCGGLSAIEIPNSVNHIDNYAFAYCGGLSYVLVQGETPPTLGWGAFEGVDHSIPVHVPCGSLSAYQNAEGWNEFNNIIEMCPSETVQMSDGWTWWSTSVELSDIDGLTMLEEALGDNGVIIKTSNQFVQNMDWGDGWMGSLAALTNKRCYKIQTSAECAVTMRGPAARPADHPITIQPEWNWIGYPVGQAQTVTSALEGFQPSANDIIKGQNGYATYISGLGWLPEFTLEPGKGYLYHSNNSANQTLVYSANRGDAPEDAVDTRFWHDNTNAYADNLCLLAVVSVDGEEMRTDNLELGAFVGDECRGSARLLYVEPFDRYFAVMTISGEDGDEVKFALVDRSRQTVSGAVSGSFVFTNNAIVGTFDNPHVVSFGTLTSVKESHAGILGMYPNPVDRNSAFNLLVPEDETITELEVVDMRGEVVRHETGAFASRKVRGLPVAGLYLVRVVCESGNAYNNRLIVK